jgi:hypothetical protein
MQPMPDAAPPEDHGYLAAGLLFGVVDTRGVTRSQWLRRE